MAYEVLVLDIDGTVTNSDKIVTDATLKAIFAIQERGHKVVLASGRPTPGILPIAKQLKLDEYGGYILSYNGAKIINCKTDEIIYNKTLPNSFLPKVFAASKEFNTGLISYEEGAIISAREVDKYVELEAKINHLPVKVVDDFGSHIDFDVNKCLMTGDGEHMAKVEEIMKDRFGSELNIYRSEPFFLEIMPQHIDKAHSLGHLLDHLGLSREQMISCGDGYNDLSMIQYAGMGVAMANAQQVVKEAADYITLSNDEDGVAHVIKEFMI
ncbi:HAD-superfamily hydrolase [Lachnospiraceae bacterium KM106-2]|nr:HAD-superfamily hydrolase [Lachnospiraceae bacterium KM106-2]